MNSRTLLFRADANITMGTGHVMRCLALAQAWQDAGGQAVFAMAETTPSIQGRLKAESCHFAAISEQPATHSDAVQTASVAQELDARWIVVDGYQFDADYQRSLKSAGLKILFLDDYGHAQHYFADLVLNQNVGASSTLYEKRESYSTLLLGPRYCMLRREFKKWRDWNREIPPVAGRLLVTMGGSDAASLTSRVLDALNLANLDDVETTVVVGGSSPHWEELERSVARSRGKVTIRRDVTDMAELMAWADVAISAAGSTCWELCLLGLPALLIDVADNQTDLARELDRRGCCIHLGGVQEVSAEKISSALKQVLPAQKSRQSLSEHCRALVDGRGANRVVSALLGEDPMRLRRARSEDARMLWEWANEPGVREASFSSTPIPWETHVAWLEQKPRQPKCLILISEDSQGCALGQVRFDERSDGDAEVAVSISKANRGSGLASALIRMGVQQFLHEKPGTRIHAFVKVDNQASIRSFERARFSRVDELLIQGSQAVHLVREPD